MFDDFEIDIVHGSFSVSHDFTLGNTILSRAHVGGSEIENAVTINPTTAKILFDINSTFIVHEPGNPAVKQTFVVTMPAIPAIEFPAVHIEIKLSGTWSSSGICLNADVSQVGATHQDASLYNSANHNQYYSKCFD